jgi:CHAT domain-containing protein
MDEQRVKLYVKLIEQLLRCPEEEEALLREHAALVDAGLMAEMERCADVMESQEDVNIGCLHRLQQLAKVLIERNSSSQLSEDSAKIVVDIVQLIVQTQGNRIQIYSFLSENLDQLNEKLLPALKDVFIKLSQRNHPSAIAAIFNEFGNLIQQFPLGSRMLNLEIGICSYEQALQIYTRDAFPEQWATTQNNLAAAYSERIQGERADNLEWAIAVYEQALQVRTRDAFPEQWAETQNNLANTYKTRIRGERADNLEWAIAAYQQALQIRVFDTYPVQWAETQNNLAATYSDRIRYDRADNLEYAILAYEQVLQVYTQETFPEQWAMTKNNLAVAYFERIRGDRADNLERAIESYEQALQVRTHDAFPEQWATTKNNLAAAYSIRIRGEQADNLERAIAAYEQALRVRTRDAFPEQWAATKNNLANVYKNRIRGERADNLERAIAAYEQALQIRTHNAFPEQWATTKNNLANAYKNRIRGEQADNLEQAISLYEQALQIYTRNAFPKQWATAQNNLATTYSDRIRGERTDNLEQAIDAYQQALQVYTYEDFPEDWAGLQNNLAAAYSDRIQGERTDNIKWAIDAYQQALQIRTRDAFPEDCRRTAQNLGNLHFQEEAWDAAVNAYQIGTAAAEALYQSSISYDGKGDELKSIADIPSRLAYAQAQLGNIQTAVLTLEQSRARGLSESLDRDRADLAQLQTLDPKLYTDYQNITQQLRDLESQDRNRMVSTDREHIPQNLISRTIELRRDLKETIAQIRQVPSYKNFLTPTKWEDIAIALRHDNPLIYLVTTPKGGVTIVATPDNIETIWSNFTKPQAEALVQAWFDTYNQEQEDRPAWLTTIDTTTRQLWDVLMGAIVQHLKNLGYGRATLIPTGSLSLLPLHSAWTPDSTKPTGRHYALDDIHFTYTPNARSLTAAEGIANQVQPDSILAIDNPTNDENLQSSTTEIDRAIASFPQHTVLRHDQATVQSVRSKLAEAATVHFSCHGTANLNEPLNSGLAMSDGLLTLRDLFDLKLADNKGIRLAILSACETGLSGLDNIDEVVSLPIGLMQAGVAGVISSLWSVSDLSTMMLLTRFYDLWRKDGLEPAIALHQA